MLERHARVRLTVREGCNDMTCLHTIRRSRDEPAMKYTSFGLSRSASEAALEVLHTRAFFSRALNVGHDNAAGLVSCPESILLGMLLRRARMQYAICS